MRLSFTTVKELKDYFDGFTYQVRGEDVAGRDHYLTFFFELEQILYKYEVKSIMDSSYSETNITKLPVHDINEFIKLYEHIGNKSKSFAILNRNGERFRFIANILIDDEFVNIRKELLSGGWSVKRIDDHTILAKFMNEYEAKIEIDDTLYQCRFLIYDQKLDKSISKNVLTNDPIEAYIRFHNQEDVKEMIKRLNYDNFTQFNDDNDFADEIQNDPSERELKELSKVLPSDRYTNLTYPDHEELHGIETKRSGHTYD